MIKRGDHPYIGQWALPGGFVNMDESMDMKSGWRELKEETNIDNIYMEQLYTWGDVGRDPRTRIISTSYMSLVDSHSLDVKANDDADDAKWFTVSCKLFQEQKTVTPAGYILQRLFKLILSNEDDILSATIKIVKTVENRANWERIVESRYSLWSCKNNRIWNWAAEIKWVYRRAFNLMPELYIDTASTSIRNYPWYRAIKAGFRRKISDMVIETNEYTKMQVTDLQNCLGLIQTDRVF